MFAILQKYDFSSKSQLVTIVNFRLSSCLRYCKSTIFQANHNTQIVRLLNNDVVCDTAKVRFFKQITTQVPARARLHKLFAILQKYDFSSKSQLFNKLKFTLGGCLRYCKSTIFQANHNAFSMRAISYCVVCDTAKVRFFKQITTARRSYPGLAGLFAILQKYDFSSKSQPVSISATRWKSCLRYCKSTIFQANHNSPVCWSCSGWVVCDTAKVRFFKQITT